MVPPRPSVRGHLAAGCALTALTVVAWTLFLRWDQHKHLNAQGTLSGPYEPWQVVAFVLTLAVAVAGFAYFGYGSAAYITPIVLTVCFSVAGATDPDGDGLWPVGAIMVFFGSAFATWAVIEGAERLRARRQ